MIDGRPLAAARRRRHVGRAHEEQRVGEPDDLGVVGAELHQHAAERVDPELARGLGVGGVEVMVAVDDRAVLGGNAAAPRRWTPAPGPAGRSGESSRRVMAGDYRASAWPSLQGLAFSELLPVSDSRSFGDATRHDADVLSRVFGVPGGAVAGVPAARRAAKRRRRARPERAGAAAARRHARPLGRVGEPHPAERPARRADDSQPRRRTAGGHLRQRRPQHAGRPALHAVGGRAAQAAAGHLLQGQPRRQLPARRVACSSTRTRSRARSSRPATT